ncbi:hypothetical protein [Mycobacterium sp. AT1]|uniref:hypothetical protein n=1 Tax=Mycobacterium sp. AT1 TaxID=1961706 RepID=UPI0009AC4201|nr:hypothetical protein [Mycobacterium sp. AT1]OPX05381.1 hypothetical protein B1790_32280 [Mycobacterium sp. AT1]
MAEALLLAMMHPADDDEYNAWADTEHLPERLRVPGILTGLRFRNTAPAPRYLNVYDLEDLAVLDAPDYVSIAGPNSSPWSKRISAGATHRWRYTGSRISSFPDDGPSTTTGPIAELLVLRWPGVAARRDEAIIASFDKAVANMPAILHGRVFVSGNDTGYEYAALAATSETFEADATDPAHYGTTTHPCDLAQVFVPHSP